MRAACSSLSVARPLPRAAWEEGGGVSGLLLRALASAVESDPLRMLVVDLEGTLRVGGRLDFIQVSAQDSAGLVYTHVFDVHANPAPLAGYDPAEYADSDVTTLRHMLEDPTILKVLHCCRGDAVALWYHHGIRLTTVLDTDAADAVARSRSTGSAAGLQKVLHRWAGTSATLEHKEQIDHMQGLAWTVRPLSPLFFAYAHQDVAYLRQAAVALRAHLQQNHMYELALALSQKRCPPLCWPATHPYAEAPTQVVAALHDGIGAVTFSPAPSAAATFPTGPCATATEPARQATDRAPSLRDRATLALEQYIGLSGTALKTILHGRAPRPTRVGSSWIVEYPVKAPIEAYSAESECCSSSRSCCCTSLGLGSG